MKKDDFLLFFQVIKKGPTSTRGHLEGSVSVEHGQGGVIVAIREF